MTTKTINFLGEVFEDVKREHISFLVLPFPGTDRVELRVLVDEEANIGIATFTLGPDGRKKQLVDTLQVPYNVSHIPYDGKGYRARAIMEWKHRLYSACYAELFQEYPKLYDNVMTEYCKHLGLGAYAYPAQDEPAYRMIIRNGTLALTDVEGLMESGYMTVPREWIENDDRAL